MLNKFLNIATRWPVSSFVTVTTRVVSDIAATLSDILVSFCQRTLEINMVSIDRSPKC
jgi:hypothetical protein